MAYEMNNACLDNVACNADVLVLAAATTLPCAMTFPAAAAVAALALVLCAPSADALDNGLALTPPMGSAFARSARARAVDWAAGVQ